VCVSLSCRALLGRRPELLESNHLAPDELVGMSDVQLLRLAQTSHDSGDERRLILEQLEKEFGHLARVVSTPTEIRKASFTPPISHPPLNQAGPASLCALLHHTTLCVVNVSHRLLSPGVGCVL